MGEQMKAGIADRRKGTMAISRASDVDPKKEATVHRHKTETREAYGKKWVPTYVFPTTSSCFRSLQFHVEDEWEKVRNESAEMIFDLPENV